jgi:hypothetical protein
MARLNGFKYFFRRFKRLNLRKKESRRLVRLYIRLNMHESCYKALNRVK